MVVPFQGEVEGVLSGVLPTLLLGSIYGNAELLPISAQCSEGFLEFQNCHQCCLFDTIVASYELEQCCTNQFGMHFFLKLVCLLFIFFFHESC